MTTYDVIAILSLHVNLLVHSWDGKGDCPTDWKSKGNIYVRVAKEFSEQDKAVFESYFSDPLLCIDPDYFSAGNNHYQTVVVEVRVVELFNGVPQNDEELKFEYSLGIEDIVPTYRLCRL